MRTEIANEYGEDSDVYKMVLDLIDERDHYRAQEHVTASALSASKAYTIKLARYETIVSVARELQEASIEDHEWGDLWLRLDAALIALERPPL